MPKSPAVSSAPAAEELLKLSGSALLNRILDEERPEAFVRRLPEEDFFWIVKRIGEADCLPLLELAAQEQWGYLLDLEIWDRDRLDTDKTLAWFERLGAAAPERLCSWLLTGESLLLSLLLSRKAEVVVKDGEEEADLPEGYFTLDGRFYIRTIRMEEREAIEGLLRILARYNPETCQGLLYGLAGILPAEAEEELYRLRNGRLAEHGFLPSEEALAVYAPLSPTVLAAETPPLLPGRLLAPGEGPLVPLSPLMHLGEGRRVAEALSRIDDPLLVDRIRLEFAGLCNRIVAADGFAEIDDPESLAASCRRAAAYLNIAMERLCGMDGEAAAGLLRSRSLPTIFRVGYGFAMDLRREVNRWRKESWFVRQGRENDFWGKPWGETLEGLCARRPLFFAGEGAKTPYRDFGSVANLEETRRRLAQVQALDRLLARLSPGGLQGNPPSAAGTFHPLLFNRWARAVLGMEASPAPLSRAEAARFFRTVRRNEAGPPYRMAGFREAFVAAFLEGAVDFDPQSLSALREALALIWEAFCREYENVATGDLHRRYSRFLSINSEKKG